MIPLQLIQLLADGKFHSGEELGEKLHLTRSAICKQVQQLADLGVEIFRVKGKGYRVPTGIELLDIDQIKSYLPKVITRNSNLMVMTQTPSTNQFLSNNHQHLPSGTALFAEHQTAGKGRRNKTWQSPFGSNIYFSFLREFDKDPMELGGLSLATGVAVANALEKFGINQIQLKWPNDVLYNYKKLSGILVELTAESYSRTKVIIGIGLNVAMPNHCSIDQSWIDVARITGKKPNRNQLAALLMEQVYEMLVEFEKKGFQSFFKHWQALDAFYAKQVAINTPTDCYLGIAKGINRQGEFILQDNTGKQERKFLHGEISLRMAPH